MVQKMILYKTDHRTFSSSESSNYLSLRGEKKSTLYHKQQWMYFLWRAKPGVIIEREWKILARRKQAQARLTLRKNDRCALGAFPPSFHLPSPSWLASLHSPNICSSPLVNYSTISTQHFTKNLRFIKSLLLKNESLFFLKSFYVRCSTNALNILISYSSQRWSVYFFQEDGAS